MEAGLAYRETPALGCVPEIAGSRVRKRSLSCDSSTTQDTHKRPRVAPPLSTVSSYSMSSFLNSPPRTPIPPPRTPRSELDRSIMLTLDTCPPRMEPKPESISKYRSKSLSRRSSFTSATEDPYNPLASASSLRDRIVMQPPKPPMSCSSSITSLQMMALSQDPIFAAESAKNHMRKPRFLVDFATPTPAVPVIPPPPPAPEAPPTIPGLPPFQAPPAPPHITDPRLLTPTVNPSVLSCSLSNVLFFTRTNRLYCKNLMANEEVIQICKLKDIHGAFTAVSCGGEGNPNVVAFATSKGSIMLYDVLTKKRIASWTGKAVSALAWNKKTLSVGYASGKITHFDTRITAVDKMQEQAVSVTRHQSAITRMEWSLDLEVLASADKRGNVYCWNLAESKVPLDVGDFGSRRKKMKHSGAVSALAWCPWSRKVLLTGDVKGCIHFWRIDPKIKESNALTPAKIETGAAITTINFSVQCKEFITTHGYKVPPQSTMMLSMVAASRASSAQAFRPRGLPLPHLLENTVAVWQFPTTRFVTNVRLQDNELPLGNAATYNLTSRIVFTVPEDGKIHTCDVWGKRKMINKLRPQSSLDFAGLIR